MKTMIEVKKMSEGRTFWVALDEIKEIQEQDGFCWVAVDWGRYIYPDTIEHLAQATRSSADPRGEMRLIRMEESNGSKDQSGKTADSGRNVPEDGTGI